MNLTFNQFLEQRDPELYSQMLNEGMIGDMAAGLGRMTIAAYKKLGAVAKMSYEFLKKEFTTDGLTIKADENAAGVGKMFEKIAELKKMPFHQQQPEKIVTLEKALKEKIAESRLMLTVAKEDKIFSAKNPTAINGVSARWIQALKYAASLGVLSAGMIGLWNTQGIEDNKYDDTYKGDTSGYVAKPSAAAETPTPEAEPTEAEPTEAPTVQSQGGRQGLVRKIIQNRVQNGPIARLADKVADLKGGDGPIRNMVHNFQNNRDEKGGGIAKRIAKRLRGG